MPTPIDHPAKARSRECSVIVPIYRNEENLPSLLARLRELDAENPGGIEAVCVVDGSPDQCATLLAEALPNEPYPSRLVLLSRNFGSFAAIREGLARAAGAHFAIMAADLQEPAELTLASFAALRRDECDVVLGTRSGRADPLPGRLASLLFWRAYRALVQRELPPGGVDVFACNRSFRDQLLRFGEAHSSLVGQLFWIGFRRKLIPYSRLQRVHGESAWTLRRKLRYLGDSLFAFSDLPIKFFLGVGTLGVLASVIVGVVVLMGRIFGSIAVPGYTATILTITFFAALNLLGLGVIGSYVWRAYENTKARPLAIVMLERAFGPHAGDREES